MKNYVILLATENFAVISSHHGDCELAEKVNTP